MNANPRFPVRCWLSGAIVRRSQLCGSNPDADSFPWPDGAPQVSGAAMNEALQAYRPNDPEEVKATIKHLEYHGSDEYRKADNAARLAILMPLLHAERDRIGPQWRERSMRESPLLGEWVLHNTEEAADIPDAADILRAELLRHIRAAEAIRERLADIVAYDGYVPREEGR